MIQSFGRDKRLEVIETERVFLFDFYFILKLAYFGFTNVTMKWLIWKKLNFW